MAGWPVPFNNHFIWIRASSNIDRRRTKNMKLKVNASAKIELEIKSRKNSRTKNKKDSWIKKAPLFILQIVVGWIIEQILNGLVALIIKIITNGSFYFNNRMFYFGENYG